MYLYFCDQLYPFASVFACEAPSAVQDLIAIAEDSVSIRVSWKSPAERNGPIIQYRLLVLVHETLLQDITLTAELVSHLIFVLSQLNSAQKSLPSSINELVLLKRLD